MGSGIKRAAKAVGRAMKSKKFWMVVGISAAVFLTAGAAVGGMANLPGILGTIGGKLPSVVQSVSAAIGKAGSAMGLPVLGKGAAASAAAANAPIAVMGKTAAEAAAITGGLGPAGLGAGTTAATAATATTGLGAGLKGIFTNPYVAATIIGKGIEGAGAGILAQQHQSAAERRAENLGKFYSKVGPIERENWSGLWTNGVHKPDGSQARSPSGQKSATPGTQSSGVTSTNAASITSPSSKLSSLATSAEEILEDDRRKRHGIDGQSA